MYTAYDNLTDEEFLLVLDKALQTQIVASMRKRLAAAIEAADGREPQYCDECGAEIEP